MRFRHVNHRPAMGSLNTNFLLKLMYHQEQRNRPNRTWIGVVKDYKSNCLRIWPRIDSNGEIKFM